METKGYKVVLKWSKKLFSGTSISSAFLLYKSMKLWKLDIER
jgi:hypothetical protein